MTLRWFTLLLIPLFLLVGCQFPEEKKQGTLTMGIPDYPPFDYSKGGQIVGYDIALAQEIANALGKKLIVQSMAHHHLIPALQTKQIDLAMGGLSITPERQKNVDFSEPYYYATMAMLYRKDQKSPDLTNLDQKIIGVQLGTTMEQTAKQLAKQFKGVTVSALDNNGPLIEKLKLGEVDLVLIESLPAKEFSTVNPMLTYKDIAKSPEGYGIAMAKNSNLVPQVNAILLQLAQKGVLTQLEQTWILKEDNSS